MVCVHSKKILINRNLCFMYRTNKPGSIDSHVCEIQVTDGHNEILLKIQVECGSELKNPPNSWPLVHLRGPWISTVSHTKLGFA